MGILLSPVIRNLWFTRQLLDTGGSTAVQKSRLHVARDEGTKFADIAGAEESQVWRAGHWRSDALTRPYLTNLTRQFMRALAGFKT